MANRVYGRVTITLEVDAKTFYGEDVTLKQVYETSKEEIMCVLRRSFINQGVKIIGEAKTQAIYIRED